MKNQKGVCVWVGFVGYTNLLIHEINNVGYEGVIMSEPISGDLHVANDVLSDLVGHAALECYGIVGMAAPNAADGIAKILPTSRLRRGVVVDSSEKGAQVDLYVVVEYGTNITTVSQNLIDRIAFVLKEQACIPIDHIEVHVQGVRVRK